VLGPLLGSKRPPRLESPARKLGQALLNDKVEKLKSRKLAKSLGVGNRRRGSRKGTGVTRHNVRAGNMANHSAGAMVSSILLLLTFLLLPSQSGTRAVIELACRPSVGPDASIGHVLGERGR